MLQVKTTADAAPSEPVRRVRRARPFRRPGRMWLACVVFVLSYSAMIAFVACGACMFVEGNKLFGMIALGCLAGFVALRIMAAWLASGLVCGLCHGEILRNRRCRKHFLAAKLPLLTHRATVVFQTAFTGRFTCMYCGSPFRLKQ